MAASKLNEYIYNSSRHAKQKINNFHVLGGRIHVQIKDPLPAEINFVDIFEKVRRLIPDGFFLGLKSIKIGQFKDFHEKHVNAFYSNGSLYITNVQDDAQDIIDDVIHEIAHLIEERYPDELYGDGYIRAEFLGKRKKLLDILAAHGYNVMIDGFTETEYSVEFDNFLYKEIGYSKLANFIQGLFLGPYSVTSVHEYFATGLEDYFIKHGERSYMKSVCPMLYRKISLLEKEFRNAENL